MRKFFIRRIFPILLCVFLLLPVCSVSVSASLLSDVFVYLNETTFFKNVTEQKLKSALLNFVNGTSGVDYGQYWCSNYWAKTHYQEVSYSSLVDLADTYNTSYSAFSYPVQIMQVPGMALYGLRFLYAADDGKSSICWISDANGTALFAPLESTSGKWKVVQNLTSGRYMVPYSVLESVAAEVDGIIRQSGEWYFIFNSDRNKIYHTPDGIAYASWVNGNQAAVNQDRNTTSGSVTDSAGTQDFITNNYYEYTGGDVYIKEGDTYTKTDITNIEEGDTYYIKEGDSYTEITNNDYSQDIDIENMTQVGPGGTVNNISELIYDASTKTYYANTYSIDESDNRTYNYTINQYHINYTSVTYIGQTEEYEKQYELYYELPDGRDSADLTREDLEQLSTSFKDVMNYARSADDLSQRALYHFDGNTEDSSYWSYASSFDWAKGASLTYMDEGVFNGSLYLDETEHDFTITLPGTSDASGDWTLQFRYYQSYTAAPQKDSYITVGGTKLLQFDGAKYYNGSGTAIASTSIGAWNELCLMRKDGVMYYYINGVYYASATASSTDHLIRFYFGSSQQTYKKLDELRFTRGAIYEAGKGYTPTSVPYDTNLSLVLPDGKIPLADEVFELNPAPSFYDDTSLSDWSDGAAVSALKEVSAPTSWNTKLYSGENKQLFYNPSYTTFSVGDGYTTMSCSDDRSTDKVSWGDPTYAGTYNIMQLCSGLFHTLVGYSYKSTDDSYSSAYLNVTIGKVYTISVVLADGSASSITYTVSYGSNDNYHYVVSVLDKNIGSVIDFEVVDLDSLRDAYDSYHFHRVGIRIFLNGATSADLLYMEYVAGSEPAYTFSYEGAVYDPGELTESPILAVRSNTPISTYQIGGVRPSYPQKGQVYAMVENGYITSLQQYTGYAWESVDGRIWTGSRWIPASSYNVITLQDMYDIVDSTEDYEYIYSESGFWDWFQRAWKDLISRLDKIIEGQGSGGSGGPVSDCQHVYDSKIERDATCTEPGHKVYTCSTCGHQYTELLDALGHDWVVTNTVPDVLDEAGAVVEEGYDELTCSRCDLTAKDYGEGPMETDLFEAIGDLIAGGISWVLDKLTELVNALTGITDTFNSFVERVGTLAGTFPLFFAAFFALIPEDLATVLWFGVVAFVVMAVWRKWSK